MSLGSINFIVPSLGSKHCETTSNWLRILRVVEKFMRLTVGFGKIHND